MTPGRPPTSDLPGQPFMRVYTVEEAGRLRLKDKELAGGELVPWLVPGQSVERIAVLGKRGGVSVRAQEVVEAAVARLGEEGDLSEELAGSPWADAARYLGSRWAMTFRWESGERRFSVTLPAGARRLGLLPEKGEAAVVFIAGSIFEIWHGERWLALLAALSLSPEGILQTEDLEQP